MERETRKLAEIRERVQRFETGRNDESDTYYRAATDRTALLGTVDYLMAVLRQPIVREPAQRG